MQPGLNDLRFTSFSFKSVLGSQCWYGHCPALAFTYKFVFEFPFFSLSLIIKYWLCRDECVNHYILYKINLFVTAQTFRATGLIMAQSKILKQTFWLLKLSLYMRMILQQLTGWGITCVHSQGIERHFRVKIMHFD